MAEALLDEVRLAVGEACSRAVEAHRRHCPAEPVRIELNDLGERFQVVVTDVAPPDASSDPGGFAPAMDAAERLRVQRRRGAVPPGAGGKPDGAFPAAFGLAVISGLADDVQVSSKESGLSVRMSWPATARVRRRDPPRQPPTPRRKASGSPLTRPVAGGAGHCPLGFFPSRLLGTPAGTPSGGLGPESVSIDP